MAQPYLLRLLDVLFVLCILLSVLFLAFSVVLFRYWSLGEVLLTPNRPERLRPRKTLLRSSRERLEHREHGGGGVGGTAPREQFRIHREYLLIHTEERIP